MDSCCTGSFSFSVWSTGSAHLHFFVKGMRFVDIAEGAERAWIPLHGLGSLEARRGAEVRFELASGMRSDESLDRRVGWKSEEERSYGTRGGA